MCSTSVAGFGIEHIDADDAGDPERVGLAVEGRNFRNLAGRPVWSWVHSLVNESAERAGDGAGPRATGAEREGSEY